MKVVLELQEQLANVRRVTVRHDIVIGRGSDCNLRLSAPQMSRRHCFLRVGRDGVSVTDLDSSNGTYVDNKRIKPGERVELKTGSILTLGPINFIVHLKDDSGSTTKSEGERSHKTTKSGSGASESSTIVSSAAAIIAEEFKSKPPLQYSVEQAGASADANEETARIKKDHASDAVGKRPSSMPASSQSRAEMADIAAPAVKKAVAAAVSTSVVAPIAKGILKAESVNPSSFVNSVAESHATEDSESAAPESSWLIDDSPDDMSYLSGHQSNDSLVPPEGLAGSAAAGPVDDIVEVLDDEDIFAEEAVELLDDETPANALTADFEEADLLDDQFLEVFEESEVFAEELVEAELIEESAEVAEVVDDDEPLEVTETLSVALDPTEAELSEVLEEPFDFFDELGIVDDSPRQTIENIAVTDNVGPADELAAESFETELAETELAEEPAEVVQVLDDEAAIEVLEEPSDFFDMLGIEVEEPQQVIEQSVAVEAVDEFDAELEEIELSEEVADAERVAESETATEPVAELTQAVVEEFAVVEEVDAVEDAWDFAEIAAEEVVEVAEEDEASNWFNIGDDKSEDEDDDPELRKFLKGF